jgi:hypothetical protein
MTPEKELVIDIDEIGNVTFDVKGCTGRECIDKSRPFEEALMKAGENAVRSDKPEMARMAPAQSAANTNRIGR